MRQQWRYDTFILFFITITKNDYETNVAREKNDERRDETETKYTYTQSAVFSSFHPSFLFSQAKNLFRPTHVHDTPRHIYEEK